MTRMREVAQLFVASAVVMGLAHTITRERMFAPIRDRLGGKETWLGYLVSCPYCVSHWLAFALVPLTGAHYVRVVHRWGLATDLLEWFLSSVLVAVIAAFLRVGFYFVDETQSLKRKQKEVAAIEGAELERDLEAHDAAEGHAAHRQPAE